MKAIYEAWVDAVSITLAKVSNLQRPREQGLLAPTAKLVHRIEADTLEEASAVHHIRLGWEPYKPLGDAADCPNGCGAKYYPQGSGECPNCGLIA